MIKYFHKIEHANLTLILKNIKIYLKLVFLFLFRVKFAKKTFIKRSTQKNNCNGSTKS